MAVGIIEIHPAATIEAVDLASALFARIGPVLQPSITDAGEDLVEVIFAYQEGVVLRRNFAVLFVEIE